MRTHDPSWEPDPNLKYSFKGKKRKLAEEEEEEELAESVRTISALFQAAGNALLPPGRSNFDTDEPLGVRVASISAGVAAAIAQAQSRVYDDDEEEDMDEEFGSGQEVSRPGMIGPNTSGIGGLGDCDSGSGGLEREGDDEDDSDAFPVPLRTRKTKEIVPMVGMKRKRSV